MTDLERDIRFMLSPQEIVWLDEYLSTLQGYNEGGIAQLVAEALRDRNAPKTD